MTSELRLNERGSAPSPTSDRVTVEIGRLGNVGEWAFFEVSRSDEEDVLCRAGLRLDAHAATVEYALWVHDEDEPDRTGALRGDVAGSTDEVLRDALIAVLERHADLTKIEPGFETVYLNEALG